MNDQDKTKEQLIKELRELRQEHNSLQASYDNDITDRKQAEELSRAQRDLALALSATTSLDAALRLCLDAAIHVAGMDAGGIYLVDGTSGDLDLVVDDGLSPAYVASGAHYPADSANAQLVKAGQPIYVRHPEMSVFQDDVQHREGLCAGAVIPVLHGMQVIACLNLASHTLDETPEDARIALETIAAQMGSTIDRVRAEEALRRAEENFRRTLDDSPLGARIVIAEGETIYANRAILGIYGYDSIEELRTTRVKNRYTPESYAAFQIRYDNRRKGEETPSEYEISIVKKNGEVRSLQVFRKEVLWNDEKQYQVLYLDITDRKQVEEALRESEENFRLIFENNSAAMAIIEPDTTISMVNDEFCRLSGYTKKEVFGTSWTQQIPPEDLERLKEFNRRRLINPNDAPNQYEFTFYHKNGEIRRAFMSIKMLSHRKIITSFVDITERKLAETEIQLKNEVLIKLIAEKDKFFSIIAHDLRSPFHTLLGFTRMMVEDLPTLTLDEIQKIAVRMRNSANKLFNLLENLLEWSQMQRGLGSFKPESFILMNGIIPIMELIRDAANKKMIRISYDLPEDLRVMADVRMFESLIRNLVFNAVKFTPKGGRVTIAAKPIPGNSVEISIRDTGIGMNKTVIDNLFRLDEQTTHIGTEGEPGTGLGLIICKDFIEKHGGKIWVESEEGKGSIFYFTIPCDTEPVAISRITNNVPVDDQGEGIKKLKILIAEDDETSDILLTKALKKISHEFIHVSTGVEAVDACRNNPDLDLVLMDIQMPEMNGYEATRQIRHFNNEVIIIAQTAFALRGERERAIEAGCNDYISKPILKEELLALIQKYFHK